MDIVIISILSVAVFVLLICVIFLIVIHNMKNINTQFDCVYSTITEVGKVFDSQIATLSQDYNDRVEEVWRDISSLRDEIDRRLEEISRTNKSYTDSRFDSSVNKNK